MDAEATGDWVGKDGDQGVGHLVESSVTMDKCLNAEP